jgi:hypothetical protein
MTPGDGELSTLVAQAWRDVLRCPGPSDEDNFFELGGHSVAGARVLSRLQGHVPVRLSIRLLFDHPVFNEFVAALARLAT